MQRTMKRRRNGQIRGASELATSPRRIDACAYVGPGGLASPKLVELGGRPVPTTATCSVDRRRRRLGAVDWGAGGRVADAYVALGCADNHVRAPTASAPAYQNMSPGADNAAYATRSWRQDAEIR